MGTLTAQQVETCALLVGRDAIAPNVAAARLGCTRDALYMRKSRARKKIKRDFDRTLPDGRRTGRRQRTAQLSQIGNQYGQGIDPDAI